MKNLRIVFMGTPEFAVTTLDKLVNNGLNIVAVVTAPDKPAGRGRKISKSAVKEYAEKNQLPVMQPEKLKDVVFTQLLKDLNANLFIIVAFRMLPEVIWKIPSIGTINLHASLLPDYRGAAPINHAIMNGETKTGVTTFFIDENIDTGNILLREELQIFPHENAGDLHERLKEAGAKLVLRTIQLLAENNLSPTPQTAFAPAGTTPKRAPKIHPADCIINWGKSPVEIHNFIRGLAPYPGARTFLESENATFSCKIFSSHPETEEHNFNPGYILSDGKNFLRIACTGGFINITSLQLEGRTRMNNIEFLRGFKISDFTIPLIDRHNNS
jgi:methionyl-tRNA formyltransferase